MSDPLRVLVVDDDAASQVQILRLLRAHGLAGSATSTGKAAIDAVSRDRYDVVLMDVVMPEMGGLEAARLIRGRDLGVVVIGVTGYDSPSLLQSCLNVGMAGMLIKPVDPAALLKILGVPPGLPLTTPDPDAGTPGGDL